MSAKNNTRKKLATNIKANPNDSFSKFALALEFLKQEDLNRAKMLFENIYNNDPKYVGVYYHLGKLDERLGQLKEAQHLYREGMAVADRQNERRTYSELREALAAVNIEIETP